MIIKSRSEPRELTLMRYLKTRKDLSANDENYFSTLEKGFKGEQMCDVWLGNLSDSWLIINDLCLERNNTVFQIDTLLVSHDIIHLIEVKNYEGDFYIEDEKWYSTSKSEIKNPLLQLKRSESLFRQILKDLGFTSQLEAHVIFINPEFHLYQAPLNLPIIFPAQLNRFKNKLNLKSPKLKDKHIRFAEQLVSCHLTESPYTRLSSYSYDLLEKGMPCAICTAFITELTGGLMVCNNCSCKEGVSSAVKRCVDEFQILFPDRKITTNVIQDWCKIIQSQKTIRRVLQKNFKSVGVGRSRYYV
ncbi:NERD domain-containing protein [Peribacillus saganii]|uniref:NERD domain-containing protein n=1 Tax=Peribacillus saganii TaxID=2303992 RepID=A0A372LP59_9BACI|nr:nuclease-related domain-containing protein [Peribacillus saganii]RFU69541.1 NERD domain-containing protein [Peribacillus saganii]